MSDRIVWVDVIDSDLEEEEDRCSNHRNGCTQKRGGYAVDDHGDIVCSGFCCEACAREWDA